MIGRLSGILIDHTPPYLLVDVQGVGYEVEAPLSTSSRLPELGNPITLHTHLIVREDAHVLCGFISEEERQLFRLLIKVNSVGAKLALGILSGMNCDSFVQCVRDKDTAALTRLPGVGKKTAERLIIEIRDKLDDLSMTPTQSPTLVTPTGQTQNDANRDAISALVSLGYKPQEASKLLQKVDVDSQDSETLIKAALKIAAAS